MFRARVAEFYRARGYQVQENVRVRGASERLYAVEMVAEGPLGALLISFGDAAGLDGAEVSRVRTLARDTGATPVLCAPVVTAEVRRLAAQMGVVIVDDETVADTSPTPGAPAGLLARNQDLEAHPWPQSGRARQGAILATAGPAPGTSAIEVDALLEGIVRANAERDAAKVLGPAPTPTPAPATMPVAQADSFLSQLGGARTAQDAPAALPAAPKVASAQAAVAAPAPADGFAWLKRPLTAPAAPAAAEPGPMRVQPIEHEATVEARMPQRRSNARTYILAASLAVGLFLLFRFFG